MRGACSSNNHIVEKVKKKISEIREEGCGGAEDEDASDWLVTDRSGKKKKGMERIEAGRKKREGEAVTANGVGLAEERWEYRGRE